MYTLSLLHNQFEKPAYQVSMVLEPTQEGNVPTECDVAGEMSVRERRVLVDPYEPLLHVVSPFDHQPIYGNLGW